MDVKDSFIVMPIHYSKVCRNCVELDKSSLGQISMNQWRGTGCLREIHF